MVLCVTTYLILDISQKKFESKSVIQINLSNRLSYIAHSVLSTGPYCLAFLENEAGTERLIAVLLNTVVKARKTMKKTIIEVQGLKKKFKEQEALAGIDFPSKREKFLAS